MVPSDGDVDAFLDSVSEASRLIDGLKAGTISPEYIDTKISQRACPDTRGNNSAGQSAPHSTTAAARQAQAVTAADEDAAVATDAAKQADLLRKVEELKANRQRKLKARQLYESYVQGKQQQQHSYATDYAQWEMWCPSDEEDDMFNSLTPNSPQFRAMEKDISSRHARMVEQRQIAERQRQLGNAAFKAGQYSEALRCYEAGLEMQRHNMTLHANAAMAALKLRCYVAAQEHCDKVLHLAEVLHNTPKHPLCVKALQRRAAAYQGRGQPGKAVADLQAAAEIVPGDAEVTEQLQRAQQLLDEHRTAKQLVRLVEPAEQQQQQKGDAPTAAGPCAADSCDSSMCSKAAGHDQGVSTSVSDSSSSSSGRGGYNKAGNQGVATDLLRIKQLTSSLAEAGNQAATANKQATIAADACAELCGLLQAARNRVFFRECSGLDVAIKLVLQSADPQVQTAGLQLLCAGCDTDAALEQLSEQVLGMALDLISSPHPAVALAALELAYAASTCTAVRPKLCSQLLRPPQLQQQQPAGSTRLSGLWQICCSPMDALNKQVLATSLTSNCMLVPAVRAAMVTLLQCSPETLCALAQHLAPCAPAGATKVCGLLGNMCSHAGLRAHLAGCQPLVSVLLAAASACSRKTTAQQTASKDARDIRLAVLGTLCNLSLEDSVQRSLCEHKSLIAELLQLAVDGSCHLSTSQDCVGTSTSSSSGSSSSATCAKGFASNSAAGLPKLPRRAKDKCCDAAQLQAVAPTRDNSSCLAAAARAATVLSRAAKQADGAQQLQQLHALGSLAGAMLAVLEQKQAANSLQLAGEWLAATTRILALITAAAHASCSSCSPEHAAAAVNVCCILLRTPAAAVEDAVKGNAALVLKSFAADSKQRWHEQLAQADAVQALLAAARSGGKGSPSSKNAGIALAVLARAGGGFIERMRELHGLEVLYEYVRP